MARSKEVIPWSIFAAGGAVSAVVIPALMLVVLAAATGHAEGIWSYARMHALVHHFVTKLFLIGVIFVTFFHCAHRLKFTIPSLLHTHVRTPFGVIFYLAAIGASAGAACVIWRI